MVLPYQLFLLRSDVQQLTCKGAKSDNLSISSRPSVWSFVITIPSFRSPPCTLPRQLISSTLGKMGSSLHSVGHVFDLRLVDLAGTCQFLQQERD